jgi:purine/pyrimidine-nucleoside phosphorylase
MTDSIPAQFDNVSVISKANVYFGGKVVSYAVLFPDGTKKTLGIIFPGEYEFGTGASERMDVIDGACRVMLAGETEWASYAAGTSFSIAENSSFRIEVDGSLMQYICSYGV